MFFIFPPNARWNREQEAVEFGVAIGEYEGVVRVPRQVFRRLLGHAPTPQECLEAYHLQRTRFRACRRAEAAPPPTDPGRQR
jgi:hypothetical protein